MTNNITKCGIIDDRRGSYLVNTGASYTMPGYLKSRDEVCIFLGHFYGILSGTVCPPHWIIVREIHRPLVDHDDVIKWKHFPRYWPFVRGIHRSPMNSPHKSQWRGALMFTLICARINVWVNNRKAGDLRRNRVHYDIIVMFPTNEPEIQTF